MKATIIARVSTEEQKEAGNSLPAQIARLESYCERKGFEIVKKFSFDESAYKDKRKEFDDILDYLIGLNESVAICFDKVDRLSRNVFDKRVATLYERALRDEVELHFPSDGQVINSQISAVEKFQFGISLGLAKYYSDAISDNVKRAQVQMLSSGIWPSKAPYGYRNITKDDGNKWIELDPMEAPIVEKMYEWYSTSSYSMLEIRNRVQETFNIKFSKGYVDFILKNRFYIGIMATKGQEFIHNYDRIITRELFDKVQEIKAGYHKKHFKFAGLPYLYRGLIRCAECGCIVTPEKKKGQYVYYHCTQYNGKHGAEWLREEDLTRQFAQRLSELEMPREILNDVTDALRKAHKGKSQFHEDLYNRYNGEYQKLEQRIEKMYEDKLDGSITEDYYNKKLKDYRSEQSALQGKQANLQVADEQYYIASDYVLELAAKASELFESSEPHEKRLLLKMTLQNFKLRGKKVDSDWLKPFDKVSYYASRQKWLRD